MTNRSRVRAVTPLLVVADLKLSLEFYGKLGFGEPNVHGEPPCFAMLNRDGFELMLSVATEPAPVRPPSASGVWSFYISIGDVAAEIAALEAAGIRIDKGPTDAFYRMREIEVLDPDGHRVCLAQDISNEPLRVADVFAGTLDIGRAKLRLVLKLAPSAEGGGLVGRLDSLDQGASNLVLDTVTRDGLAFTFELKAIGARFEGNFDSEGSTIDGKWSQGAQVWPLRFTRA